MKHSISDATLSAGLGKQTYARNVNRYMGNTNEIAQHEMKIHPIPSLTRLAMLNQRAKLSDLSVVCTRRQRMPKTDSSTCALALAPDAPHACPFRYLAKSDTTEHTQKRMRS